MGCSGSKAVAPGTSDVINGAAGSALNAAETANNVRSALRERPEAVLRLLHFNGTSTSLANTCRNGSLIGHVVYNQACSSIFICADVYNVEGEWTNTMPTSN